MPFLTGAQHLQNIHPLVIHFPIAFLYGAALFYFLSFVFKKGDWEWTAFWMLILGAVSIGIAVGTGLYAEPGVMVSHSVREHLLEAHEKLMIVTASLCGILTLWALSAPPFPKKGRPFFLLFIAAMLVLMTLGADFGGRMVYDYNAGGFACHQPIECIK